MLLALWSPKGGSGTSVTAAAIALVLAGRGPARLADLAGDQPAILGLPPDIPGGPGVSPEMSGGPGVSPEMSGGPGVSPEMSRGPGVSPDVPAGLAGWLAGGPGAPSEALDRLAVDVAPGLALLPLDAGGEGPEPLPEAGAALAAALRDGPDTVLDAGLAAGWPVAGAAVEVADASVVVVRGCYLALRRAVRLPLVARAAGVVLVDEPGRALGEREVAEILGLPVLARFPVRPSVARAVDAGVLAARLPGHLAGPAAELLDALPARRPAGQAA